jgi:heat shock protein HslJ
MKKSPLLLTILFILAVILIACSSASADITGEWELISIGNADNPTPAIPNVATSIKFDSNAQMSGNVGCNSFGGNYKISGDTITFSSTISTMMYCEETSAQEQLVLGIFSDNVNLQLQMNGDTLTITSADGASVINLARK